MLKRSAVLPFSLLALATMPVGAQEVPRMLFCMGQCIGVAENGTRVPLTKGTEIAPGLRLETGPGSYAQVKLGRDSAFGIGERARVRFDRRDRDRDLVTLDQGRIRVIGGEAIGKPVARPVELRTTDGNFILRSADLEVKSLPRVGTAAPSPTLVKLNLGDVRLGDLPVTRDGVHGIVGGKILDQVIPISEIALAPRPDPSPAGPGAATGRFASPPIIALPVINLPAMEPTPIVTPIFLSPAIVSPDLVKTAQIIAPTYSGTLAASPTLSNTAPVVSAGDMILAQPVIDTSMGTTSLNTVAKSIQTNTTTTTTSNTTYTLQNVSPTNTGVSPKYTMIFR